MDKIDRGARSTGLNWGIIEYGLSLLLLSRLHLKFLGMTCIPSPASSTLEHGCKAQREELCRHLTLSVSEKTMLHQVDLFFTPLGGIVGFVVVREYCVASVSSIHQDCHLCSSYTAYMNPGDEIPMRVGDLACRPWLETCGLLAAVSLNASQSLLCVAIPCPSVCPMYPPVFAPVS